jgi:hypothetical protein
MRATDTLTPGPIVPPPAGMLAARVLDNGRVLALVPLTFGRVRLVLGPDLMSVDEGW